MSEDPNVKSKEQIKEELFGMIPSFKKFFKEHGIEPESFTLGFSEKEQKWYGYTHRAIGGFGIGSTVKKGDIAYIASTPEGLIEDRGEFFGDISEKRKQEAMDECQILDDRSGIRILHAPLEIPMASSMNEAVESIYDDTVPELPVVDLYEGHPFTIELCGRGEWTAKTLDDAKQMAIDYAKGCS